MNELTAEFIWIILMVIAFGLSLITGLILLFKLLFFPVYIVEGKKIKRASILKRKPSTFMIVTFDGIGSIEKEMVFGTKEEAAQFIIDRQKQEEENNY